MAEGDLIIRELAGEERVIRLDKRNRPFRPFENPTKQRVVTTLYPGNPRKTVQILGAYDPPVTFDGIIRDWFNFEGFADDLEAKLRSICNDGNLLEVECLSWRRQAILEDFTPSNQYAGYFDYALTFEVLGIVEAPPVFTGDIATPSDISSGVDSLLRILEDARAAEPLGVFIDGLVDFDIAQFACRDAVNDLIAEITQSNAGAQAFDTARRLGESATRTLALADEAQAQAQIMRQQLAPFTPESLSQLTDGFSLLQSSLYRTGLSVGVQDLRTQLRTAQDFFEELAATSVRTTIFGRAGRTLSELSLRFYGTVHDWPRIARANQLRDNFIESAVELIIPD